MNRGAKTAKPAVEPPVAIVAGSGNVFADLGLPNPGLALAKARLVQALRDEIAARGLTLAQAAAMLGIDQPKVSAVVRGQVAGISLDRLMRWAERLGQQVEVQVRAAPARR
jgi:predicted XRE-type DNA-binding protein